MPTAADRSRQGTAPEEVGELLRARKAEPQTRGEAIRSELGETAAHARRAAGHAAGGMFAAGVQVAPMADRARRAASERMAATRGAFNQPSGTTQRVPRRESRRKRRGRTRWTRLLGLLVGGAALGAAAAAVRRRREMGGFEPEGEQRPGAGTAPEAATREERVRAAAGEPGMARPEPSGTAGGGAPGTGTPGTRPGTGRAGQERSMPQ